MGKYLLKVLVLWLVSLGVGCVLIWRQLGSLLRFLLLVVLKRLVPKPITPCPATIDAYDRVDGSDPEKALAYKKEGVFKARRIGIRCMGVTPQTEIKRLTSEGDMRRDVFSGNNWRIIR